MKSIDGVINFKILSNLLSLSMCASFAIFLYPITCGMRINHPEWSGLYDSEIVNGVGSEEFLNVVYFDLNPLIGDIINSEGLDKKQEATIIFNERLDYYTNKYKKDSNNPVSNSLLVIFGEMRIQLSHVGLLNQEQLEKRALYTLATTARYYTEIDL